MPYWLLSLQFPDILNDSEGGDELLPVRPAATCSPNPLKPFPNVFAALSTVAV